MSLEEVLKEYDFYLKFSFQLAGTVVYVAGVYKIGELTYNYKKERDRKRREIEALLPLYKEGILDQKPTMRNIKWLSAYVRDNKISH